MKIFIIHAPAGAGHKNAAYAIKDAFDKAGSGHDVRIVDCLSYTNPLFKNMYVWGYDLLVSRAPLVWAVMFYLTDFRPLRLFVRLGRFICNGLNGFLFYNFILRERPDCVISTHFFPTETVSNLKRFGLYKGKLMTCVTDYGVHAFWVSRQVDIYVVASEWSKRQLNGKGIDAGKIRVLGIPIQDKFSVKIDRATACAKLGLDSGLFNVLIMGGGLGVGPIRQIVEDISESGLPFTLVVVCGKNEHLLEQIKAIAATSKMVVRPLAFIENVQEYMSACDILISKPGGISLTEAMVKGLPVLVASYIAGHEGWNLKFLEESAAGLGVKGAYEAARKLRELYASKDKLDSMREKARHLGRPNAADDIVSLALESFKR